MVSVATIRVALPVRSEAAPQKRYALYRDDLRRDFLGACGYCGDEDARADRVCFHIDHFAPKIMFPDLECAYDNLIYACRFCNVSKSDHWIGKDSAIHNDGERGFVDPCSEQYETHLTRDQSGRIQATTALGTYFAKRLRLGLLRHELLWQARRARSLRNEVQTLIIEMKVRQNDRCEEYIQLLERYIDLNRSIEDYELRATA
jgi:uncharacterized protein (TIGR02646 family)